MKKWLLTLLLPCAPVLATAQTLTVELNAVNAEGVGASVGNVVISQTNYGLVFTPTLSNLTPGIHGFHIHNQPSCEPAPKDGQASAAEAAGSHWNPGNHGHGAPWEEKAHLGDLPALYAHTDGQINQPVLAPRLKNLEELKGRSLMIHAGGDNHADHPQPLGGGGARVACGVIK